jgi:hypothetical protein
MDRSNRVSCLLSLVYWADFGFLSKGFGNYLEDQFFDLLCGVFGCIWERMVPVHPEIGTSSGMGDSGLDLRTGQSPILFSVSFMAHDIDSHLLLQ